jgi:AraC family transcriptional regulator of adaptative response/methylated-DNA-[protein]-cysteine methyltransferase
MLDQEAAFAAFDARDRTRDGAFVAAVRTTGIYCKPSCPARRPRRENVAFYADGAAARVAGYRPCLRCRPDEADRDRQAVARALALIEAAEGVPSLAELAGAVGYSGPHFQRLFRREVGISPAAYARALRAGRLEAALQQEGKVTEAIYEAGYGAASRAYADAGERLGMAPSTWRGGGAGETICHAVVATSLGPLLVAATERGLCRIAFDEDAEMLRGRFPRRRWSRAALSSRLWYGRSLPWWTTQRDLPTCRSTCAAPLSSRRCGRRSDPSRRARRAAMPSWRRWPGGRRRCGRRGRRAATMRWPS